MGTRNRLLSALADGALHSGEDLAQHLGCSRTAIWKHLRSLEAVGVQVESLRGSGYRLRQPIELLTEKTIRDALMPATAHALSRLELHDVLSSTSDHLRELPPPAPGKFDVALAEYQTGGRGRRGRQWQSPYGSGLCLSVSWWFDVVPSSLPTLSLAVGAGVCRVLRTINADEVGVKWPNDLIARGAKLGGLLVDVQGEADGPIRVIIGLGINIDVTSDLAKQVQAAGGLPVIGLRELSSASFSRNELAAALINELHAVVTLFESQGFTGLAESWRDCDALYGQPVTVLAGERETQGIARGIGEDGALLLECDGRVESIVAGEVSLRPQKTDHS